MALQDGFGLEHVDRGHARPAAVQCRDQSALGHQLGARGVHEQCRRLHLGQILGRDDAARCVAKAQMHGQHISRCKEGLTARGGLVAVGLGPQPRRLAAPDLHGHAEGAAIAGDELADLAVAPDSQRLATQQHADAEIGRHGCRLQPRLLPGAMLEVADVLRQPAHGCHDQRPGQLGRRDRAADAFGHGNAQPRAGLQVDVAADAAGLGDELQLGELFEQLAREGGALPDQHQYLGVAQPHGELPDALHRVGEDLGVQRLQLGRAAQLADSVLVVIENDHIHVRSPSG
mmetsp:Transcript_39182/g.92014  ORF Transcript_39182/g.92014 Transcript_39182/m.92014 type:complete len:288 (+) Transcript_39182:1322-2185(+)